MEISHPGLQLRMLWIRWATAIGGFAAALYGGLVDQPRWVLTGMVLFVVYARVSRDSCDDDDDMVS